MGDFHTILITGASRGLGRALALEYAAPGRTLLLHGRDTAALDCLASECRSRGAEAQSIVADLADASAWARRLAQVDAATPIDLAFVNAGVASFDDGSGESWDDADALLAVNVRSAIATAATLAAAMRSRGHGHLALISSLAAWHGLARTPAYSASKAAIKAYGEALHGSLRAHGVGVTVVMPGYIRTSMAERDPRSKPWMLEPGEAARHIARAVAQRRARVAFPWPVAVGTRMLALLPAAWASWIVRRLRY